MDTSEALQLVISDDQRAALALAISRSDGQLPQHIDQLADQLGVSVADLAELLNDRKFIEQVRAITKAQANLTFHQVAINRLVDIASNGKPKLSLSAIQLLGKISGDLTPHKIVDMRVTFDDLRKRATGDVDPLANLFEIKGGDVIEVGIEEEATDDFEEWESQHE